MAGKYRLQKQAKEEMIQAAEWYESQQNGVGERFFLEAFEKIEKISDRPESHSCFHKDFRRASLSSFPYWIVYVIRLPFVFILSVWHKKRNPDSLLKNLEKSEK